MYFTIAADTPKYNQYQAVFFTWRPISEKSAWERGYSTSNLANGMSVIARGVAECNTGLIALVTSKCKVNCKSSHTINNDETKDVTCNV